MMMVILYKQYMEEKQTHLQRLMKVSSLQMLRVIPQESQSIIRCWIV